MAGKNEKMKMKRNQDKDEKDKTEYRSKGIIW